MTRALKDISKYKGDIVCHSCGSIRINKFGKRNNKQKYICRECRKVFILGDDDRFKYSNDFKLEAIKLYLEGMSIRGIGRIKNVQNTVVLKWIRNIGNIIKNKLNESITIINNSNRNSNDYIKDNIEILEIDENKDQMLDNGMFTFQLDNSYL